MPLITRMQSPGPVQPSVPGLMPLTASMPIGRAMISQPPGSARYACSALLMKSPVWKFQMSFW
jgi:hypothetical protein